ncbi:MAG TPA: hypothetical protein VHZ09_19310 [Acidobacteriaceae bacterium]|jgi:hypothetical protein|nr:hypothetical protein [Acidobacteriaceae bacterium]
MTATISMNDRDDVVAAQREAANEGDDIARLRADIARLKQELFESEQALNDALRPKVISVLHEASGTWRNVIVEDLKE